MYQINGQSLIHNTPPWVSIDTRMCLVKTLLGKILWDKKPSEGKRVHHFVFFTTILFITYSIFSPHVNLHHQGDEVRTCESFAQKFFLAKTL